MLRWDCQKTIHHFYTTSTSIHHRPVKIYEHICTIWSNQQSNKTESDALLYKALKDCDELWEKS